MREEDNPYASFAVSERLSWGAVAIGTIAYFVVSAYSDTSLPFFAAASTAILVVLAGVGWPLRKRRMLWFTLSVIAVIHVVLLILIRLPHKISAGVVYLPVFVIDIYVSAKILEMTISANA